nr:MAG TPA: hypothetical protein [Caudoviricetes sp.]
MAFIILLYSPVCKSALTPQPHGPITSGNKFFTRVVFIHVQKCSNFLIGVRPDTDFCCQNFLNILPENRHGAVTPRGDSIQLFRAFQIVIHDTKAGPRIVRHSLIIMAAVESRIILSLTNHIPRQKIIKSNIRGVGVFHVRVDEINALPQNFLFMQRDRITVPKLHHPGLHFRVITPRVGVAKVRPPQRINHGSLIGAPIIQLPFLRLIINQQIISAILIKQLARGFRQVQFTQLFDHPIFFPHKSIILINPIRVVTAVFPPRVCHLVSPFKQFCRLAL